MKRARMLAGAVKKRELAKQIMAARKSGMSLDAVARKFNISQQRVIELAFIPAFRGREEKGDSQ